MISMLDFNTEIFPKAIIISTTIPMFTEHTLPDRQYT